MSEQPDFIQPAPREMPPEGWVSYVKALKNQITTEEEYVQLLRNNFVFFIWELWIDRGLQDEDGATGKAPLSNVEIDAANFLEAGPRRRIVLAFRGIGKTHIMGALCLFRYNRDPSRQIVCVSKSEREVKKTCKLVRRWISSVWFLKHLEPLPGQPDGATYFEVNNPLSGGLAGGDARQPSMWILGIGGQLEGNRGHTFIFDDIETKTNTRTLAARLALRTMANEFDNIAYPHREFVDGGPIDPVEIIGVGTPKHEETLYVDLQKRGYIVQSYPIAFPFADQKTIALAPILRAALNSGQSRPGDPTCPLRFNEEEIAIRRMGGLNEYLKEFMLCADMGNADPYPLKLADLLVFPVHRDIAPTRILWGSRDHNGTTQIPDSEISSRGLGEDRLLRPIYVDKENWLPFNSTKAGLDPAGRGTDKTGLAIVSHLAGLLYLKRIVGLPGGVGEDSLHTIATELKLHDAREVHIESNIDTFGTFENQLTVAIARLSCDPGQDPDHPQGWNCRVIKQRAVGVKEWRIIDTLEPVITSHRLVVDPACLAMAEPYEQQNDFQFQLTRIIKATGALGEDGMIDALQIAVKAWQHITRMDPKRTSEELEQARLAKDIDRRRQLFSNMTSTKEPSWISHLS
jgi:hypothetical protein